MEPEVLKVDSKQTVTYKATSSGRPKRARARRSYCEVETDDECTLEDVKQLRPKGKVPLKRSQTTAFDCSFRML